MKPQQQSMGPLSVQRRATETIHDSEGDRIPAEAMLMITLADNRRIAVRPSGTEPKIKYYMFAARAAFRRQGYLRDDCKPLRSVLRTRSNGYGRNSKPMLAPSFCLT